MLSIFQKKADARFEKNHSRAFELLDDKKIGAAWERTADRGQTLGVRNDLSRERESLANEMEGKMESIKDSIFYTGMFTAGGILISVYIAAIDQVPGMIGRNPAAAAITAAIATLMAYGAVALKILRGLAEINSINKAVSKISAKIGELEKVLEKF